MKKWSRQDIVSTIALILMLIAGGSLYWTRPVGAPALSIEQFKIEYKDADDVGREVLAARYMQSYPASLLLNAAEELFPVCHFQAHPIGRVVYQQEQNFSGSVATCGKSCNDGCFHGVLMEMFKTDSDNFGGLTDDLDSDAYVNFVVEKAHDLCSQPELGGVVEPIACLHGIGHVFAFTSGYEIAPALDACKTLANDAQARFCSGGAYMEYMGEGGHDAELDQKDFTPCEDAGIFTEHCFRYKATHLTKAWGSPQAAMKACASLPFEKKIYCIRGVSFWATTRNRLDTPDALKELCGSITDADEHYACVYGAVLFSTATTAGADESLCDSMAPQYEKICRQQVAAMARFDLKTETSVPPPPKSIKSGGVR